MNAQDQSTHHESARLPVRILRMYPDRPVASHHPENLICPCAEGWHVIPVNEISHCSAEGNYVSIFFGQSQSVLASKTLRSVEQLLPLSAFVKCHQSHLVAIRQIRLLTNQELILVNAQRLPVSRTGKARVKEAVLRTGVRLE